MAAADPRVDFALRLVCAFLRLVPMAALVVWFLMAMALFLALFFTSD
ncbi:hypothetical protein [Rhodococcus sp. ACPA1]|nr:hypothetical protein [Rhodococcus sp. ACPA1]